MKKIGFITTKNTIIFEMNWLEYIFLKRFFLKKKYRKIPTKDMLKGLKSNILTIDEADYIGE